MEDTQNRILSYDIIRIIAIAMVVLIHSSADFVVDYLPPSAAFMWGNILNSISRAGVPLFVMLSGALMLNEHKNVNIKYIVNHIISMVLLLIVWSLIYAVGFQILLPIVRHEPISLKGFIGNFIMGHYHLWFMYMIIGLYLVTPILRLFVKEANKTYILYFVTLSILFQFTVPVLNFISNQVMGSENYFEKFIGQFSMDFVGPFLAYYLLGWYISNTEFKKKSRTIIYILGALGLTITILGAYFCTNKYTKAYVVFYSTSSLNVFLYSIAVYIWLYLYFRGVRIHNIGLNKFIKKLSTLSFGVYVIHEVIRPFIIKLLGQSTPGYTILLIWLTVLIISYSITFVASGIPIVKKLFKC